MARMTTMSREEVAQLLYEVGFRDDDLVSMVAIAGRESGYRPEAHRTNRDPSEMVGDFGLFQINYINDTPQFREAIGMTDRAQLLDPEMNARAAVPPLPADRAEAVDGRGGWLDSRRRSAVRHRRRRGPRGRRAGRRVGAAR